MSQLTINNWKSTSLFIAFVTIFIVLIAWLIQGSILPINRSLGYTTQEFQFIQFWLRLAVVIGIVLPFIGLLLSLGDRQTRKIWGFYLLAIAFQIPTEILFSRLFFPSIVVIVGTLYTAFRLWQLWEGQKFIAANPNKFVKILLQIVLLFWSANAIVLLTLNWPNLL